MILILSDEHDWSTSQVIDWLHIKKIPYYRINDTSSISVDYVVSKNGKFDFKLTVANHHFQVPFSIFLDEVKGYWYRRGAFFLEKPKILNNILSGLNIVGERFNKYLAEENTKVVDFFYKYFSTIPHLGCFNDNLTINKVFILFEAQKEKVLIPDFIITKKKTDVVQFLKKHSFCIVKGIEKNSFHIKDKISLGNLAKLIMHSELDKIPTNFNYSFLQQYIDKKADIRIFYLDGKIYSTAIFSQNDEKTKIDFRNYNDEKPNRIQPFKLPDKEEKKLKRLMKKLNYKTGSIDYVLDKSNDLYFLEINPIGQYGFISNKCNLFLDKEICNYFKSKCYV